MSFFTEWKEDLCSFTDGMIQKVQKEVEDSIDEHTRAIRRVAHTVDDIIDTAEKAKDFIQNPEKVIWDWINQQIAEIKADLHSLMPTPDKVHATSKELSDIIVAAAKSGVNIIIEVDRTVALALDEVKSIADIAGKAISDWLKAVHDDFWARVSQVKGSISIVLPDDINRFTDSVIAYVNGISAELVNSLQMTICEVKKGINGVVDRIYNIFTPIREFLEQIWKALFGVEPEQFQIAAQWFQARMERLENEQLFKRSEPMPSILIKRYRGMSVLPADETIWKTIAQDFISQEEIPSLLALQARLRHGIICADPKPGSMLQISIEEPYIDDLGGSQRVAIGVLYYRWRSDLFRNISAGFFGIVYMVCAVSAQGVKYEVPPTTSNPGEDLQIDTEYQSLRYHEIENEEREKFAKEWTHIGRIKVDDGSWQTR